MAALRAFSRSCVFEKKEVDEKKNLGEENREKREASFAPLATLDSAPGFFSILKRLNTEWSGERSRDENREQSGDT